MKNINRTHALLSMMATLALGACNADTPEELEPRVGPRPAGDVIGARAYAPEASQTRLLCPEGVGCSTADVNRDGKDDLVRYDSLGIFGTPGSVEVAYSNGWDFGPMRTVADGVCVDESACTIADVDGDGIPDLVRFIRDGDTNPVEAYLGVAVELGDDLRFLEPTSWTEGLCGQEDFCSAADIDGDGRADLVAFEGGQDGRVMVSRSGDVNHSVTPWVTGMCIGDGGRCRLGDVDGDGTADIVELDGQTGSARVALAVAVAQNLPVQIWADDITFPPSATFQLGDFDGDRDVDVMVMGGDGSSAEPDPMSCEGSCGADAPGGCWCDEACAQYGDCCADYQPQCVVNTPPAGDSCTGSCGGGAPDGCWCDELCVGYGDCCADYQAVCIDPGPEPGPMIVGRVQIWAAMGDHFNPAFQLDATGCDPGLRCWAADVTGDGRADLVSVDDPGLVTLWPAEDVLDRLERDAMRLSLLRADWERRRVAQARRVLEDVAVDAVPLPPWMQALPHFSGVGSTPPTTPTESDPATPFDPLPGMEPWSGIDPGAIDRDWFIDQDAARVAEIEAGIAEVLDALPPESGLLWTADQLRWQKALGKVIAARTSLYAPALGVSSASHGGACHNAVIHDRIADDGVDRHEGSYVSRYYDALRHPDLDERLWASLPALTGVVEGMRCLSEREVAGLEESFVRAVLATMDDLLARGHEPLAQIVWDQALPVELLLFDGVKSFTMPKGWQMLQVRIAAGAVVVPEIPVPGSDFDQYLVEDTATCSTVRCGLYKGAARATVSGQNLTLDTLGVWLPDLTARDRLRKSVLNPQVLLDAMVNLEVLGEGDCPLIELSHYDLHCKSERTCQLSAAMAEAEPVLGMPVLPGMVSSPYTHLGTDRAELAAVNECSVPAPGAAVPSPCLGPSMRGHRGKHFPLDPQLDAILSCTLETYDGETPTSIAVDLDFGLNPACLVSGPGGTSDLEAHGMKDEILDSVSGVAQLLADGTDTASAYGYPDRDAIASVIMSKMDVTYDQVISAMQRVGQLGFDHLILNPASTSGTSVVTAGPTRWDSYSVELFVGSLEDDIDTFTSGVEPDVAANQVDQYMFGVILRAGIDMVLLTLATRDETSAVEPETAAEITDALGLGRSCDPASSQCSGSCGYNDARMQRFSECLAGGEPAPFDRCTTAEDYCATRRNGELEYDAGLGCEAPALPPLPPLCAAVNCDGGSDLVGGCCGGVSPSGELPPYGASSPDPGPHPGDPDGMPPVPGGPFGGLIPPLPTPAGV